MSLRWKLLMTFALSASAASAQCSSGLDLGVVKITCVKDGSQTSSFILAYSKTKPDPELSDASTPPATLIELSRCASSRATSRALSSIQITPASFCKLLSLAFFGL